jgi:aspartate/methionine/tyrosine aminotransferase
MVVPPDHVAAIEALMQNLFICAPHISQVAALAALDACDELDANLTVWRANRDLLVGGLPSLGFGPLAPPDGAFFLYAAVGRLTEDSRLLCAEILHEAGVAMTPGNDFDPVRGKGYVRICYACSAEDAAEGLARLRRWVNQRASGVGSR